jgi:hypothetical protein
VNEKPWKNRCDECRYWREGTEYSREEGECRRFPPLVTVMPDTETGEPFPRIQWPRTYKEEWCGEWAKKALI